MRRGLNTDFTDSTDFIQLRIMNFEVGEDGNFTRLYWAIRGHKFAYPGRKDTINACFIQTTPPRWRGNRCRLP